MAEYGNKRTPKHPLLCIRIKALRQLVFLSKKLDSNEYGIDPTHLDLYLEELDTWIMDTIKCSKRTAFDYRNSLLMMMGYF